MKLVDRTNEVNLNGYSRTKNQKLLESFAESDMQIAEIENHGYASVQSAQTTLYNSIKVFKMTGIKVKIRKDKIYLVKEI